jgi:hypothetical protein
MGTNKSNHRHNKIRELYCTTRQRNKSKKGESKLKIYSAQHISILLLSINNMTYKVGDKFTRDTIVEYVFSPIVLEHGRGETKPQKVRCDNV